MYRYMRETDVSVDSGFVSAFGADAAKGDTTPTAVKLDTRD